MSLKDINSREDILILLSSFYNQVRSDVLLEPVFNKHIKDWDIHLNKIADFWENIIFNKKKYKGNPLQKHLQLNTLEKYSLTKTHFDSWLSLWEINLDRFYAGKNVDLMKTQAAIMAKVMLYKMNEQKISVTIIGFGRVGNYFYKALKTRNRYSIKVYNRLPIQEDKDRVYVSGLKKLTSSDIFIIAVNDSAISEVLKHIPYKDAFVVHTSGSVSLDVLDRFKNRGVLYPVQSFSKNSKNINFPVCLTVNADENKTEILKEIAIDLSDEIIHLTDDERKHLHLAAVFVNNFTNELYSIAEDICKKNNIPFSTLQSLILESVNKISVFSPKKTQTGPAKRNDKFIISEHKKMLKNENIRKIYTNITDAIINRN